MKKIILLIASLTMLACEQEIKDGKIPANYQATAQQYAGQFVGQFNGQNINLDLQIDPTGLVSLTSDQDLVSGCSKQIGKLIAVNGDKKNYRLKSARFDFDGPACGLAGSSLEVKIIDPDHLSFQMPAHEMQVYRPGTCQPQPMGGTICSHGTYETVIDSWFTGEFTRR
jgi:hypothetical protein